jgi:hypothetical protein
MPAVLSRLVVGRRSRKRTSYAIVALGLFTLLVARPAAAREATLLDLEPFVGRIIIIETTDRPQVVARLISTGDSAIVASVAGMETTLRDHEVRTVWVDGDSTRIGLAIGAGVGVAGAILGAQGLSCNDCPGTVAAGAAFSIIGFTALGGLIGKHHHRRITVYRRP